LGASLKGRQVTGIMTFDSAVTHAIDYGKFIVQLWNYYILLVVAMLGWLVTLRSKTLTLDLRARMVLVASFGVVSLVFFFILEQNHKVAIHLMQLVHALSETDPNSKVLAGIYGPVVNPGLVTTLKLTSRLALPVIAVLIALFMWFITAPMPVGEPASGKMEN
jgi:hypothetical protein